MPFYERLIAATAAERTQLLAAPIMTASIYLVGKLAGIY